MEQADEVALEVKMQGDHSDLLSFDRASLRRLARQVQRREDPGDRFGGESSLWYVASHVPAIIKKRRPVTLVAPGCYRIGPDSFSTFWIAARENPYGVNPEERRKLLAGPRGDADISVRIPTEVNSRPAASHGLSRVQACLVGTGR